MNILIIEDSKSVAHIIKTVLETNGYNTTVLDSKNISSRYFTDRIFEIVISDVSLTYGTPRLLSEIRKINNEILIIGISTKSTWKEKVEFLNHGGDDVLDYPFPMQELFARMQTLLKRPKENTEGVLKVKDFEINTWNKQVKRKDRELALRKREYQLFEYMVRNKNRTISRAELLDHVWDYRRATGSNTVDVHVKRLRDRLEDKDVIETIHGFGYTIRERKNNVSKASSA